MGPDADGFEPKQFLCLRLDLTTGSAGATEDAVFHGEAMGIGRLGVFQTHDRAKSGLFLTLQVLSTIPREFGPRRSIGQLKTGL